MESPVSSMTFEKEEPKQATASDSSSQIHEATAKELQSLKAELSEAKKTIAGLTLEKTNLENTVAELKAEIDSLKLKCDQQIQPTVDAQTECEAKPVQDSEVQSEKQEVNGEDA